MSWTEKKLSLPSFLGSNDRHTRSQDYTTGVKTKEEPPILKCAVLKKIRKNNQFTKKFFVLYDRTANSPARLVYYDSEKKHAQRLAPKREIILEKCFNINRKQDTQDKVGKKVLALNLYTQDDCVQISLDTEDELNEWLEAMLVLQQGSSNFYGKKPKPNFDVIWQVNVKGFKPDEKNDSKSYQGTGPHRMCVTPECSLLYPLGEEKSLDLPHPCIRNIMYNNKDKVLGLELGRTSPIGAGVLTLESEEKECVIQLHEIIRKEMIGANPKEILGIGGRYRSSSLSQGGPRGIPHMSSYGKTFKDKDFCRNRTISEPVGEGGKQGTTTPDGGSGKTPRPSSQRYSPLSPTSPVGSVSAGLSDDGTGSSNSINDPTLNGDMDCHMSYAPDVIPEESSGEVSIEFKSGSSTKEVVPTTSKDVCDCNISGGNGAASNIPVVSSSLDIHSGSYGNNNVRGETTVDSSHNQHQQHYHQHHHYHQHQQQQHYQQQHPLNAPQRKDEARDSGHSSLPRKQRLIHKKQPSLPDYMVMAVPPPLPARNQDFSLSTSLPTGNAPKIPECTASLASPTDSQKSSSFSSDYHVMSGLGSTQQSTPLISPDNNYLPMDLISQASQSTPPKSNSSQTLVPGYSHVVSSASSAATSSYGCPSVVNSFTPPRCSGTIIYNPGSLTSPRSLPQLEAVAAMSTSCSPTTTCTTPHQQHPPTPRTPHMDVLAALTSTPVSSTIISTDVTGSGGKKRIPSGEGGYVIMSPGVNLDNSISEEPYNCTSQPSSRAKLEESLGGRWHGSPHHSSPVLRRRSRPYNDSTCRPSYPDSQRNSSCLDDTEALWSWRLNDDSDCGEDMAGGDDIGRSPVGPNEDYMLIDYNARHHSHYTPRPISRVSPASSSSAMSVTPSSSVRLSEMDSLVKVKSYFSEQEDDKVTSRPPRGEVKKWGRHIDIPSSKSSSRSNISPFGRTPPSGASNSPTVASRLEGWIRHRAGSVPNRPPLQERRRHRTQSEGEKDTAIKKS